MLKIAVVTRRERERSPHFVSLSERRLPLEKMKAARSHHYGGSEVFTLAARWATCSEPGLNARKRSKLLASLHARTRPSSKVCDKTARCALEAV